MAQYAELHDGTRLEFPDETAPEVIDKVVKQHLTGQAQPVAETPQKQSLLERFIGKGIEAKQQAKNILGGTVQGAADIGATILSPVDYLASKAGIENEALFPKDRRAAIEQGLRELGVDTKSGEAQVGRFGAQMAGTAGVGGAIAKGGMAIPMIAKSPAAMKLLSAIESGGLSTGVTPATTAAGMAANAATRIGGGAISGGAMAGMVNPDEALTGAAIGGAIPIASKILTAGIPAITKTVAGVTSGVGNKPLEEAYKAGQKGGIAAKTLRENISGEAPIEDALIMAKNAAENMKKFRGAQYRATIGKSFNIDKPLDFAPIETKLNETLATVKGKGSAGQKVVSPEQSIWVDKFGQRVDAPDLMPAPKLASVLDDIKKSGGINVSTIPEFNMTPSEAVRRYPGLFTKSGQGLDELSRTLEQKGWVPEHVLADADYALTGGREGYGKDMIAQALDDPKSIVHPSQADDWYKFLQQEEDLSKSGYNKVTIPAKFEKTSGEYWTIGKEEQSKIKEVQDIIAEWKTDAARHNVEGLDALKRRIGAVYPDNPKQHQAQRVIDTMYNTVKHTIENQAPDYAATMQDYAKMTDQIREIERSLSLGDKASKDTAMRKLQSLMRNNVSTNYGGRLQSADQLGEYGAENLMPALAGQALNDIAPRGIARAGNLAGFGAAAAANPLSFLALPIASPRAVGEAAYGAGVASRYGKKALSNAKTNALARAAVVQAGKANE